MTDFNIDELLLPEMKVPDDMRCARQACNKPVARSPAIAPFNICGEVARVCSDCEAAGFTAVSGKGDQYTYVYQDGKLSEKNKN